MEIFCYTVVGLVLIGTLTKLVYVSNIKLVTHACVCLLTTSNK